MTPLLEVNDLRVGYRMRGGMALAVQGVSFDVARGEVLGLVGESGCGKSTLGFSLIRLVPPPGQVVGGQILLDGLNVLRLRPHELRELRGRRMAMIFQNPMTALNPTEPIGVQIAEIIEAHTTLKQEEVQTRVLELLELVGIPDGDQRAREYPHQYSGGMRQRALIAIAVALNPDLLIADEPTTALDLTIQAQILWLLQDLQQRLNMSMIYITHDLEVAASICNRIAVMYAGHIVELAPTDELFGESVHPYANLLIRAVPQRPWREGRIAAVPGQPPALRIGGVTGCPFAPRCPLASALCREQMPDPEYVSAEHWVRCHHWRES